jgi:broad specificity phosphatase PhoE
MTERNLYLVRHGLPDYRFRKAGDIWPGPPLSTIGYDQARQAAGVLAGRAAGTVYHSPFTRTVETAGEIGGVLGCPLRVDPDLREWYRSERLSEVGQRLARWLVRWLRTEETAAAVVSHASPLLAILRSALYLPHVAWHKTGYPHALEVSSGDRFEVSMASVFELSFTSSHVTACCLFHPTPRVFHQMPRGPLARLPRQVVGHGENHHVRRPNFLHLLGARL